MAGRQATTTHKQRTLKENMVDYLRRHSHGLSQEEFIRGVQKEFDGNRNYIQRIIREDKQSEEPSQAFMEVCGYFFPKEKGSTVLAAQLQLKKNLGDNIQAIEKDRRETLRERDVILDEIAELQKELLANVERERQGLREKEEIMKKRVHIEAILKKLGDEPPAKRPKLTLRETSNRNGYAPGEKFWCAYNEGGRKDYWYHVSVVEYLGDGSNNYIVSFENDTRAVIPKRLLKTELPVSAIKGWFEEEKVTDGESTPEPPTVTL